MEEEEAIKIVRRAFDVWESEYDTGDDWSEKHKARDMAIKALEQEPCENDKIKEKILYDLEHPDLQNEKRYGFEGGLMYAREVIEKYL